MRASLVLLVVLTFPLGVATAQTITVTSSSPAEAKLAAIDARSEVVQQSTVRQYARLLDALDGKCKENRTQIGDFAAKGVRLLAEKKVTITHLKFLQSMNGALPEGSEKLDVSCAEIAALLVTMINADGSEARQK